VDPNPKKMNHNTGQKSYSKFVIRNGTYGNNFDKALTGTSVADPDPGSGAFLPTGSGIRILDEFFRSRISDPWGMFFGEIFLRILVL
jgi:hypothetical protein